MTPLQSIDGEFFFTEFPHFSATFEVMKQGMFFFPGSVPTQKNGTSCGICLCLGGILSPIDLMSAIWSKTGFHLFHKLEGS